MEDCNYLLDYYRLSGDKRLIYGGGVIYGARDPADIEAIIRPKMLKTFPQLKDVKIDFAWTGSFLLTLAPAPGRPHRRQHLLFPGLQRPRRDHTHVAGKVLAEALRGQAERFDAFAGLPLPLPRRQAVPRTVHRHRRLVLQPARQARGLVRVDRTAPRVPFFHPRLNLRYGSAHD